MMEKRLRMLGILGVISLLSYTAMVVLSPLAYPGYDWLSMAVSDLSAEGAPSAALANQLNALFGPCGLVSIMAVCVGAVGCKSQLMKLGIYLFAAMEWICSVGYQLFPWVSGVQSAKPHASCRHCVGRGVFIGVAGADCGRNEEGSEEIAACMGNCLPCGDDHWPDRYIPASENGIRPV